MSATHILLDIVDGVGWITLDGPEHRNALDRKSSADLVAACDEVDADPSVGAVVVTGAGTAFCSGADTSVLASLRSARADEGYDGLDALYSGFRRFAQLSVPSVAAVNGAAVGAGLNLALAADLRIARRHGCVRLRVRRRRDPPRRRAPAPAGPGGRCHVRRGGGRVRAADSRRPGARERPGLGRRPSSRAAGHRGRTCRAPGSRPGARPRPRHRPAPHGSRRRRVGARRRGRASPAAVVPDPPDEGEPDVPSAAHRPRTGHVDRHGSADIELARSATHRAELDTANRANKFPRELYRSSGGVGYLGPLVPAEWGGLGGGVAEYVVINEEVGRHGLVSRPDRRPGPALAARLGHRRAEGAVAARASPPASSCSPSRSARRTPARRSRR